MATKKAPAKKKPVSKAQATNVAAYLKDQKAGGNGNGGPAQPTPKQSPVATYDDDADDQGA